jgi:hypothetical protein
MLLLSAASAQVIQVTGGDSTIYQGGGAAATLYFPSQEVTGGAGIFNGHAGFSAADSFRAHGYDITAGDHGFSGALDGLGGVFFTERGISAERDGLGAFIGSTGIGFGSPYAQTFKAQHIALGFYARRKIGRWTLGTVDALSGGTHTTAGSVTFTTALLKVNVAGGLLASRPLSAGLLDFHPVSALHFTAQQQNVFWGTSSGVIDSASVFAGASFFSLNASAFSGHSGDEASRGVNAGCGFHFGPITENSAWFSSGGHAVIFHAITESTHHWAATQTISQSRGQTNVSGGLSYHSNRMSVSISQGMGFSPTEGFERTTSLTLTLHVRDTAITVADNMAAKQNRWSAYAQDYTRGPYAGSVSAPSSGHTFHQKGKFMIQGVVKDTHGQPVEGAAVALSAVHLYSDSEGKFTMRTNAKTVTVTVIPEDFSAPGKWKEVSAPETASAEAVVEITVERIPNE